MTTVARVCIYFTKYESIAFAKFQEFKVCHESKLRIMRSNRGEYKFDEFAVFCKKRGQSRD